MGRDCASKGAARRATRRFAIGWLLATALAGSVRPVAADEGVERPAGLAEVEARDPAAPPNCLRFARHGARPAGRHARDAALVLDAVALVLRAHPEFASIEVVGSATDDERRPDALAAARAAWVVSSLVARGVPETRLVRRIVRPHRVAAAPTCARGVRFEEPSGPTP